MKKSKIANLERRRFAFFQTGLILAAASVLVAFEWVDFDKRFQTTNGLGDDLSEIVYEPPIVVQLEKPKVKTKQQKSKKADHSLIPELTKDDPKTIEKLIENLTPEGGETNVVDTSEIVDIESPIIDPLFKSAQLDKLPEFPGGLSAMYEFFGKNLNYTSEGLSKRAEGKVFVSFTVDKNGVITNAKIEKDIGYGLGEEVVRVMKTMPLWEPGMKNGKKVNSSFTIPVKFKLR